MNPKKIMTVRLGLALLMAGTALGAAAEAQTGFPVIRESPGDALTRHLRTIADQPRNVSALTGAGQAALKLGDPQAALTFFARAEEIAPRDGRIKAGMAAAFVQMEQVHAALKFFQDAASLGVPEAEFAGDRGLAHDLNGDPRRAQADYTMALRRQEDPEVRRRLALSLAISGERDKALAAIDGQLRAQDRAAWRIRSFVLALTGDPNEATRNAEAVMPAFAAQMRPFFAALSGLRPAERAAAVHFGHFPDDGRSLASATQYASAAPVQANATPPAAQSSALPRRGERTEPASTAPRRRPGTEERQAVRQSRVNTLLADRYGSGNRAPITRNRPRIEQPVMVADARRIPPVQQQRPTASSPQPARQQPSGPGQAQGLTIVQRPQPVTSKPVATTPVQPALAQSLVTPPQGGSPASTAPSNNRAQPAAPQPIATAQLKPVQPDVIGSAPAQQSPTTPQPASGLAAAQPQPATSSPQLVQAGPPASNPQAPATSPGQGAAPGFSLRLSPSVPATAQTPTSSSVRLADLAPSIAAPDGPSVAVPATASPTPSLPAAGGVTVASPAQAESQQPARSSPLASIAAAIESLPTEAERAAKASAGTQLAANSVPKPAYGPRFETRPAAVRTPEPPKKEAEKKETPVKEATAKLAKKEEPKPAGKKPEGAKKEAEKKEASGKEATVKLAKKEEPKAGAKKLQPAKKEEPGKKEPSRHWVQVAGGANEEAMTREFLRLRAKAPKLLSARTAWTTPLRATNRLLVGPFKTAEEAQDFVNELAKLSLPAFSWTSPAGQEIVKLASK